MKKVVCYFLTALFLFNIFVPLANCADLTKTQIKSDITTNTNALKVQLDKLNAWSLNYGDILIDILDETKFDNALNYLEDEDYIGLATYLNGFIEDTTARTELLKIAYAVDPLLKNARVNLDEVLLYMDMHKSDNFSDNMDFFVSVYKTFNTLKGSFDTLVSTYQDNYSDEVKAKYNRYANLNASTLNSKVRLIKQALENHKPYFKKIEDRYIKFEDLYFEYELDDLDDDIFSSIEARSNEIATNVKKFSDKLYNKMVSDVDQLVTYYDMGRYSDVDEFNDDIYVMSNNLGEIKTFINKLNRKQAIIDIPKLRTCYDNNYSYLLNKLNSSIEYTLSKLKNVENGYIESLNNKVVINNLKITAPFMTLDKLDLTLKPVNGTYIIENSYIVNKQYTIGTNTKVVFNSSNGTRSEYIIVVRGDVKGDGLIDSIDLARMAKTVAGLKVNWNSYEASAADVNGDNEVDSIDLARIAKTVAGIK